MDAAKRPLTLLCFLLVVAAAPFTWGRDTAIDMGKFVQDLQRMEPAGDKIKLIWWIPSEYWEESFRTSPMTEAQKRGFIEGIDDYFVVAIVDGTLKPFGPSEWAGLPQIRQDLELKLANGEKLRPLADEEIAVGTQTMLLAMKPVFVKMLGDIGQGFEFVCFRGKDDQGERIIDPVIENHFTIRYLDKDYSWRLPLGSLLPPRVDITTREQFPGNYRFNPFTGAELSDSLPAK